MTSSSFHMSWSNEGGDTPSGSGEVRILPGEGKALVLWVSSFAGESRERWRLLAFVGPAHEVVIRREDGSFLYREDGERLAFLDPDGQGVRHVREGDGDVLPEDTGQDALAVTSLERCSDWANAMGVTKTGHLTYSLESYDHGQLFAYVNEDPHFVRRVVNSGNVLLSVTRDATYEYQPTWFAAEDLGPVDVKLLAM